MASIYDIFDTLPIVKLWEHKSFGEMQSNCSFLIVTVPLYSKKSKMTLKNGLLLLLSGTIYVTNLKTSDKHAATGRWSQTSIAKQCQKQKNPVQTSMSRKLQTQYNSKFSILKSGSFTIATALSDWRKCSQCIILKANYQCSQKVYTIFKLAKWHDIAGFGSLCFVHIVYKLFLIL